MEGDNIDMICNSDIQRIIDSIPGASSDEKNVLLQDLKDCAKEYMSLLMEFRFVAKNGDRIYYTWDIKTDKLRDMQINGIKNPVLIAKYTKLFNDVYNGLPPFLKHENEMSPEEYAWCFDLEEVI